MAENTDALTPPPTERGIKPLANLLESVPPQYRQEFGSGPLVIGDGLEIKGEGEERKLHVTINPDDPEYQEYKNKYSESIAEISKRREKITEEDQVRTGLEQKLAGIVLEQEANFLVRGLDSNSEAKKQFEDYRRELEEIDQAHASNVKLHNDNWALDAINNNKKYFMASAGSDKFFRILFERCENLLQLKASESDPLRKEKFQKDFDKNMALVEFAMKFPHEKIACTLAEPKQKE